MFSRGNRLSRADFSSPATRRLSSAHFSVSVPSSGRGYAVVVSKKTARLSVTRHKMKRRVASAMRALALPPAVVVFPKKTILELPFAELKAELAGLLSRV